METLLQRVRSVMNLLLVWSLLLLWVASVKPPDIHRLSLSLQQSWNRLFVLLHNGGEEREPSLAPPKQVAQSPAEKKYLDGLARQVNSLYAYYYSSISSQESEEPRVSAKAYIERCEKTLQALGQGIEDKHAVLRKESVMQEYEQAKYHFAILRWQVEKLELSPVATLADVAHAVRPHITIPGSGSVPMAIGVAFSILALPCVYFYLISLLRTLREAIAQEGSCRNRHWLLLHPGWLGPVMGLLWLTLPVVSLYFAGKTIFSVQAVNTVNPYAVYAAPFLPITWLWSMVGALRVRRQAWKKAPQDDPQYESRIEKFTFPAVPLSQTHRAA